MLVGNYLGSSFQVWNGRHIWFWFVVDNCSNRAAVGAAANEADAVCEARRSIEEMESRRLNIPEVPSIGNAAVRAPERCDRAGPGQFGWNQLFANLERYLHRLCEQRA